MIYHIEEPQSYKFKIYESYRKFSYKFQYSTSTAIAYQINAVFNIFKDFLVHDELPTRKLYEALHDKVSPVDIKITNNCFHMSKDDMFKCMIHTPEEIVSILYVSLSTARRLKSEVYFLVTGLKYRSHKKWEYPNKVYNLNNTLG